MMAEYLEVGKIYPSIKAMCEILNLKYKDSTDSRKAILKEIERFYSLEKQGRKFKVLEKYDTPKEKIDNRKNNGGHVTNTKYDDLLDQLLLDWLASEKGGNESNGYYAITTRNQLFIEEKGVINIPIFREGYKELFQMGYEEFAKKHDMSKGLVLTYSQKVRKITETHLEIVLNRLQRENIIQWQKNIMVKLYSTQESEIADEDLENQIIETERATYKELDIIPFHRVNPKVNKKFINAVCKNFSDLSSYWRVYNIDILNNEFIENSLVEDEQLIEITNKLIILYINSTNQAVKNKENKTKEDETKNNVFGKKRDETIYKPYTYPKHIADIDRLNRLIWLVPEGYKTESEELVEAFAEFSEEINFDDFDNVVAW
jgi:hypothetical protein